MTFFLIIFLSQQLIIIYIFYSIFILFLSVPSEDLIF